MSQLRPGAKPARRPARKTASRPAIQECGYRLTTLGPALYIKVRTEDYRQLAWREVWDAFADSYPGSWAAQFFPPADELVDEANVYHLFVLDNVPEGVNVRHR